MIYHTGDDAENKQGTYRCSCCTGEIITMLGLIGDKFPPCPYSREGTDYTLVRYNSITNIYEPI